MRLKVNLTMIALVTYQKIFSVSISSELQIRQVIIRSSKTILKCKWPSITAWILFWQTLVLESVCVAKEMRRIGTSSIECMTPS